MCPTEADVTSYITKAEMRTVRKSCSSSWLRHRMERGAATLLLSLWSTLQGCQKSGRPYEKKSLPWVWRVPMVPHPPAAAWLVDVPYTTQHYYKRKRQKEKYSDSYVRKTNKIMCKQCQQRGTLPHTSSNLAFGTAKPQLPWLWLSGGLLAHIKHWVQNYY